jgi:F-type H+-transporting ATPase subunit b
VSPRLATFLFELVNFLLLAAALGWLLFRPVRGMLQKRQAAEKQHAEEVAARRAEADRLRADWQQRHAALERELSDARAARMSAADQEAAAIVARAREAAERERDRTAAMLSHVERAQLEAIAQAVAEAARDAVARLLTAIDAPDLESSLVAAACRRLQALEGASVGDVIVESAAALAEPDRAAIAAALGTRAASTAFRVVPSLGAGVRVTTARGLVDASAAGVAAEAERRLRADLVVDDPAHTP